MADIKPKTSQNEAQVASIAKEKDAPPPIIEVREISKRYGSNVILDRLSFDVAAGEKIALIGPSGSGKTTILRILMTLESLDEGSIKIDGKPLWQMEVGGRLVRANEAHLHRMRTKVGMVFQLFNLFPHKTVLENVSMAPILTKNIARVEAEQRAMELLDMVGMADKAREKPAQLSGGQKQRVAISRAQALQPKIILLEEVNSAHDTELV
jgi:polar amino acid transport system ATP-binding protein